MSSRVRVVGLGPGGAEMMTESARRALEGPVVRLRTRRHPAVEGREFESYDALYDVAESFDELYEQIVADLVDLAHRHGEVVYAVPGSPVVAESTVERLRQHSDVELLVEPAVSVLDVASVALGIDPMAKGIRLVDALADEFPSGPGPWLILQTYSPAVMAHLADVLGPSTPVTLVHHAGLGDEEIRLTTAGRLSEGPVDHLTSVYVTHRPSVGQGVEDLVALARRLRAECPWDQEQTHGSLVRHLVEETYEALEALENFAAAEASGEVDEVSRAHVVEELGDVLYQIVFHCELGDETGSFSLLDVVEALEGKLISRHPHVFGDEEVASAAEVEARWEEWKAVEKSRESVTDGVPFSLPALALIQKLQRRGASVGLAPASGTPLSSADLPVSAEDLADALEALVERGASAGLDVEGVLRERARVVRETIRRLEGVNPS